MLPVTICAGVQMLNSSNREWGENKQRESKCRAQMVRGKLFFSSKETESNKDLSIARTGSRCAK